MIQADLWALYRMDYKVALNAPDISLLCKLIERLMVEPWSQFRAELLDDPLWFGWTTFNEQMTWLLQGLAGEKADIPRPTNNAARNDKVAQRPRSVAELDWGSQLAGIVRG